VHRDTPSRTTGEEAWQRTLFQVHRNTPNQGKERIDKDNEIGDVLKDELRAMQGEADTDKLEIERGILLDNVDSIKRTPMD